MDELDKGNIWIFLTRTICFCSIGKPFIVWDSDFFICNFERRWNRLLKIWPVVCWLGRFLGGIRKNTGHFDNLNASDKVIYANLNNKVCASLVIMRDKVNLEEPANSVINSPQTRRCGLACPLCFYLYRLHWVKKVPACVLEKRESKKLTSSRSLNLV